MNSSMVVTRRQTLQTAGALCIRSAATSMQAEFLMALPKRVIVVGGGIGGLCCAYELVERGHDVTLLEAKRRAGGQMKGVARQIHAA